MSLDQSKILEYKVGIFVVASTLLFVAFIMILGGDKAVFSKTETLKVVVEESLGLNVGAVIQVAGIPCGKVRDVKFDPENGKVNIALQIESKCMPRITQGSTAAIQTQGALGDKFVAIKPGVFGARPLQDGDTMVAEVEGDFLSKLGRSGSKIDKAFSVIDTLEKIVVELDERGLAKNLAETVQLLKSSTSSIDEILKGIKGEKLSDNKIKRSLDHLASILEKIDSGKGSLGGLINDPTVHDDLKTLLGGAKRSKLLKFLIRQSIQKGEEENGPTQK